MMKKLSLVFIGVVLLFFAIVFVQSLSTSETIEILTEELQEVQDPLSEGSKVVFGGVEVFVDVVDTLKSRTQGLSGREGLEENEGMLFVFDEPGTHGIWMRDMLFSIDILWAKRLSEEGKIQIVHIEENIAPDTFPDVFRSPTLADYVLEVPAGFAERQGIMVGDEAELVLK